ncbi:MAG: ATP-binding protein [Sporolactobacillus sp.]
MISSNHLKNEQFNLPFNEMDFNREKAALIMIQGEKIILANSSACQLLTGNERHPLKNMYLSLFIDQNDLRKLFTNIQHPFSESFDLKPINIHLISKDQGRIPVSVVIQQQKYNEQLLLLLTLRRIKKTETKTTESQARLIQLGQLSAQILHEVRNPLTAIKGFVQFMQRNPSAIDDYLPIILNEINYMEEITSDLLSLAKPQQESFSALDLPEIAQKSLLLFEEKAKKRKIRLELSTDDLSHRILGNPAQLKQVFINLIKNAIEAIPESGKITLTFSQKKGKEEVSIRDTGTGISQETLEQIGTPFFTTKERGTGLGLAICRQILQFHHGYMTIRPLPKSGTLITLTLPAITQPVSDTPKQSLP